VKQKTLVKFEHQFKYLKMFIDPDAVTLLV